MRHNIVRAAVLSTLVIGGSLAYALSTGPVASRTGVPGFASKTAEPACNVCHGAGLVPAELQLGAQRLRRLGRAVKRRPRSRLIFAVFSPIRVHLKPSINRECA